jgi:hypothetical protein
MSAHTRRIITAIISVLLLVGATISTYRLITELRALQMLQVERAEIEHVKYGLLDAEAWVDQLSLILANRIEGFELTDENRPQLKRNVEIVLDRLLQEIEQVLQRRNAEGSSWLDRIQGSLRQGVQDWLVDFDSLRARVPLYADAVLEELDRPQTRTRIKQELLRAIDAAAAATFSRVDRSRVLQIQQRRGCATLEVCPTLIAQEAEMRQQAARIYAGWTLGFIGLLFALNALGRGRTEHADGLAADSPENGATDLKSETMIMLSLATLVLLSAGVMTPMIEVEARIDQLSFTLLGEPVSFSNQVLYFQSKSILDVVRILAATGAADMILVAVLIVLFSLIFPAAKILAGSIYFLDARGLRRSALIRFFALRSGKWSMADVLVVAIFMAYIGFNGLIASQLADLGRASKGVNVISTNGTALQLGFFMFLAFVFSSLLLSTMLEAHAPKRQGRR